MHLIAHTKNDIPVHVDLIKSGAAKEIARQPHLLTLAAEVIQSVALHKSVVKLDHDMKRSIGYDFVVETSPLDVIFYGRCVRDDVYTRFTKNGKPLPTSYISLALHRTSDADYILHDLWIGRHTPPRPGDPEETAESKEFWQDHAFVFENQRIQPSTLTKTCPY